jgi:class 3 adenylate cyclase
VSIPVSAASHGRGALLLADISGYTGFLQGVADAHVALIVEAPEPPPAYSLLSHLLDTILESLQPMFRLAKLEGDAVFAVEAAEIEAGDAVLERIRACYAAFSEQLGSAGSMWTCQCAACARIDALDLKFVVHHGAYVIQPVAGQMELLGPAVNVAHRLLKNHARELVGHVPYVLVSDAALDALGISTAKMTAGEETYEGMPPILVHVLALTAPRPATPLPGG